MVGRKSYYKGRKCKKKVANELSNEKKKTHAIKYGRKLDGLQNAYLDYLQYQNMCKLDSCYKQYADIEMTHNIKYLQRNYEKKNEFKIQ